MWREHDRRRTQRACEAFATCRRTIAGVAFWIAALFPIVHVVGLAGVATGTAADAVLLWSVAGHGVALIVGYRYRLPHTTPPDDRPAGARA